jgi:hypothetical protein
MHEAEGRVEGDEARGEDSGQERGGLELVAGLDGGVGHEARDAEEEEAAERGDGELREGEHRPVQPELLRRVGAHHLPPCPREPPWRQPRGKSMVSLVRSHSNAASWR